MYMTREQLYFTTYPETSSYVYRKHASFFYGYIHLHVTLYHKYDATETENLVVAFKRACSYFFYLFEVG